MLSQLVCNPSTSSEASYSLSSSSTESELMYATSDEAATAADEEEQQQQFATETATTMDPSINKIVTEIQLIASNESLNGELEPMRPRKAPKKYATQLEKKNRFNAKKAPKDKKAIVAGQLEVTLTGAATDNGEEEEILKRVKKVTVDRNRRETLDTPFFFVPDVKDAPVVGDEDAAKVATEVTSTGAFEEVQNSTEEFLFVKNADVTTGEFLEDLTNTTEVAEVESSSPAPSEEPITSSNTPMATTTVASEIPATPHSAQPKGALTHPMHISSDMTKEQQEAHKLKEKVTVPQDHFVPPMLMVMKSKHATEKSQDNQAHAEDVPQTIERTTVVDAQNDISKFYPASTQKTISDDGADRVVLEIKSEATEINGTTTAKDPTEATTPAAVSTETEVATTTESAAPVTIAATEVKGEDKKYHSEFTFTNIENYQPYRPNRRRSLTPARSHSYLRKILG